MHQPMLKFTYSVLRRDSKGVVQVDEYDDYHTAVSKCAELARIAKAHEVQSQFYAKMRVEEVRNG